MSKVAHKDAWKERYRYCSVCGKPVERLMFNIACHRKEKQPCSAECVRKDIIRRFACCDKAVPSNCVCAYSFKCPQHGVTHIGTHD
jgi:hypothetical protein